MIRFLALFSLLVSVVSAQAQPEPPDTLWTHAYGGTNFDEAYGVAATLDGGFFITGRSRSFSQQFDVWLVRTDPIGDTLWTRVYGGTGYDQGAAVCENEIGGAMMVGWTQSFGMGGDDMYMINTDADGDTLWTLTYGTSSSDRAYAVAPTIGGGFVVAGTLLVSGHGYDAALLKISATGTVLWTHTYGLSTNTDEAFSVQPTDDGGYILGGRAVPPGSSYPDMYAIRTDANGDTLWTRRFGGNDSWEVATGVVVTTDGGCALGGWVLSGSNNDFYVVKVSGAGQQEWAHAYGGPAHERANAIQLATDGGYILAGSSTSYGAGSDDYYFVKTDSDGDTTWTRTNGGSSSDVMRDVKVTSDGGYIGVGGSASFGTNGSMDYWAVRLPGFSGVGGFVRNFATQEPLPNVWVGAVGQAHRVRTDAIGHYVLTLPPGGIYDIHTSGACVARDTIFNIEIFQDSITVQDFNIGVPLGIVPQTSVNIVAYNHVTGTDTLKIFNDGLGILDFSITPVTISPPTGWLTIDPPNGSILPGDSMNIAVLVLADTTDDGVFDFYGTLTVHMNSCPDSAVQVSVIASILDADDPRVLQPSSYDLSAFPNPFNPVTTLSFSLPRADAVKLTIYDLLGREVRGLLDAPFAAGTHRVAFDASALPSGIYLARLQTSHTELIQKLLLLE